MQARRPALVRALAAFALAGLAGLASPAVAAETAPTPPAAAEPAEPTVALPAPPPALPRESAVVPLYFFSPDWRPADLGKLTVAIEGALASGGVTVAFQAFVRYEDFEQQVRTKPPVFVIAPAWLEASALRRLGTPLKIVARPLRRGKTTYRKALMTRANIDSIDDLARGSLAATVYSMGPGSPDAVLEAFHLAADSARVVPVPKDVDALLALNFGQVDAALVTSEQYEQFDRTSPPEAEKLSVLAFSPEVKLPPVFACGGRADGGLADRLEAVLLRLGEIPQGAAVLAMLGFDAFVAPAANGDTEGDSGAKAATPVATGGSPAEKKAAAGAPKAATPPTPVAAPRPAAAPKKKTSAPRAGAKPHGAH